MRRVTLLAVLWTAFGLVLLAYGTREALATPLHTFRFMVGSRVRTVMLPTRAVNIALEQVLVDGQPIVFTDGGNTMYGRGVVFRVHQQPVDNGDLTQLSAVAVSGHHRIVVRWRVS